MSKCQSEGRKRSEQRKKQGEEVERQMLLCFFVRQSHLSPCLFYVAPFSSAAARVIT